MEHHVFCVPFHKLGQRGADVYTGKPTQKVLNPIFFGKSGHIEISLSPAIILLEFVYLIRGNNYHK